MRVRIIVTVLIFLLLPVVSAQQGGSVQRSTITGTGATLTGTISAVNVNQSFILFTTRTGDSAPAENQFTANFSSPTQVQFQRYTGPASATIDYQIISSPDISVQRGTTTFTAGSDSADISLPTAVDESNTFAIVHGRCDDTSSTDNNAGFFAANITNTTNLILLRGNAGDCPATANWQVVTWNSTTVHKGQARIQDSQDSTTDTFPAVNTSQAFLIFGSASIGTDPGMDSNLIRGTIDSSTQISFTHEPGTTYGSSERIIEWFIVEKESMITQGNTNALAADNTQAVTQVNESRAFHVSSGWNTGGGQTYANSFHTMNLSSPTQVTFDKQTGSQTQNLQWYLMELPEADPIPHITNLSVYPETQTNYTQGIQQQFNATITSTNGSVGFEFNGVNYTATNLESTIWSVNITNLAVGIYSYYWWALNQGIEDTINTSAVLNYQVNQTYSAVHTYLDNSRSNITIERLDSIYLNASRQAGEGLIQLLLDGAVINQGVGPLANLTAFNTVGVFNVTGQYVQTQNFTASFETWHVTVQDTTPPNISNIQNTSITDTSALVVWNTDELANSTVYWGNTTDTPNISQSAATVTTHSVALTGLTPNATYYYNVSSCDPYDNCNTSAQYSFTTLTEPDIKAPELINITVTDIHETNATIHWETDEPANGTVLWGHTTSLGNTTVNTNYLEEQNIVLTNLTILTTYYFNVTACDLSGNCNTSAQYNFTTVDETAPSWINNRTSPQNNVQYAQGASYQFNVTWTDNIAVDAVTIEHNFTGTLTNSSTSNSGGEYYFDTTDLPAGTYSWRMHANDTTGNTATTDSFVYTITRAPAVTNLTLNGTDSGISIRKDTIINLNASMVSPSGKIVRLLLDGSQLLSAKDTADTDRNFTATGIFNITARFDGDENYTSSETTFFVTVTDADPSYPTNVQAENDLVTLGTTITVLNVTLANTYNSSKTFIKVHHASGFTTNAEPDESTTSVRLSADGTQLILERYATQAHTALVSYSILQADNIEVINFTKNWALAEETDTIQLTQELESNYQDKCFIETHRNIRVNSATISDFAEQEVQATITNTTHISLQRDTEGGGAAAQATQYGYVVCFLDETTVQTGTFSVAGDLGSEADITIDAVTREESFSTISYYQADDGVGQNALMPNITSATQLTIHRDEAGGGQTAFGRYYVIDFEDNANASVQHIETNLPGIATLTGSFGGFTPVDQSVTMLHCENTMTAGGGTAHTRSQFVFEINSTNDGINFQEGRSRGATQTSDVLCQVIAWPTFTTYTPPVPIFTNESVSPDNATNYTVGAIHEFNITVNNSNGSIGFEFNGVNYTATNNSQVQWTANISNVAAGEYTYRWWAIGVEDLQVYFSDTKNHLVNKTYSAVYTYLNNSRSNATIERLDTIYLNGTRQEGENNTIQLYLNGTLINQGESPLSNLTQFTNPGTYNITTLYAESQNYTASFETWYVIVQDATAPNISNVQNVSITDTSALITWSTDELANSTVHWENTTDTTNISTSETLTTTHSIPLINLTPNTTYYYNVTSCDPYNNCNTSVQYSFTTLTEPDVKPPVFILINVSEIHETNGTITIQTDESANASVQWGHTTNLGNTTIATTYLTEHDIFLTNLTAITTYYFNVTSCDLSGNCNTSIQYNFTTTDETPPNWTDNRTSPQNNVQYTQGASYQFNVTWTDNIAVDTVTIEHNFTGILTNNTTAQQGNEYYFNISDLPAGTYFWRMHANDTTGNTATTDNFTYTITRAPAAVNLTLNATTNNITLDKKESINITAHLVNPLPGTIRILQDSLEISSATNVTSINRTFNVVGIFNITAIFDGNQNYSSAQTSLFVTVNGLPPSNPTNVQAENDLVTLGTTITVLNVSLTNTYDPTKTFIKVYHASGFTTNAEPDESTTSVRLSADGTQLILERYATQAHTALVSYSILQADNIEVINFTKNWALAEETDTIQLTQELESNYQDKCFIETHRNIRVNSANINDFAEQEVQATITNTTHISLQRDTEGGGAAAQATQYGYVVCFLDETTVQTGTFSVAGDLGSEADITVSSVNRSESFATISYYQADDGVGQNALMPNITSATQLTIHRDEAGGGQTAFGRYYLIDFENEANANVQHIETNLIGSATLTGDFGGFTPVDQNKTILHCENTMTGGGGTAHTRSQFVFEINSTNDGINYQEGRSRTATQLSDILCQVIAWPNATSYAPPADMIVTSITLPSSFVEGVNSSILVNITNNGTDDAENVTTHLNVSYWNGSSWNVLETLTGYTDLIESMQTIEYNLSWKAFAGTVKFTAYTDATSQVNESNETNNNLTINTSVPSWQIYYGYVSTDFYVLSDGNDTNFTLWPGIAQQGNIYALDTDHTISYLDLLPLNESGDLAQADVALNMTGHNDSLAILYDSDDNGLADNFKLFEVANANMLVPVVNTTNSSNFQTGILWDSSYGGSSYDGSQPLVFITFFNGTHQGFYGVYDYEMRVPSSLQAILGTTDTIDMVLELT